MGQSYPLHSQRQDATGGGILCRTVALRCSGFGRMIELLTLTHGGDLFLLPVRFYSTALGCGLTIVGTAIAYPKLWWRNRSVEGQRPIASVGAIRVPSNATVALY